MLKNSLLLNTFITLQKMCAFMKCPQIQLIHTDIDIETILCESTFIATWKLNY